MAQRAKVKDLVIFIPGMMGSRLLHNGVPIWGDDSPGFLAWIRKHGDDLGRLAIGPDDPDADDLGDGITADGLVEQPCVIGRFLRTGGYSSLLRFFEQRLGLRAGRNLQLFAYDWRRDLRVAARRLAARADGWLHAWQAQSGNDKARVVLIGHAMGGLVARYYFDVEGGWPTVRQIITIGAPFRGSVRALDLLYSGVDLQSYGFLMHDVTPIARTFTSVYQLLPHYPSIQTFTGEIVSPFDVRIPTFEHQKMERSRQFHRDLVEHHSKHRLAEGYALVRATSIVGVGQPTIELARLLANGTLSVDADVRQIEADGDGIVPRVSADAAGPGAFNGHSLYLPVSHGGLVTDAVIQGHLGDLLIERKASDPPPTTPLPRFTLRRTVADQQRIETDALAICIQKPFYKTGQPVEIRALARAAGGHTFDPRSCRVTVRVEQLVAPGKRVRPTVLRLTAESGRPGWYVGRIRATVPGTYRATATASHKLLAPFRVSDLFEVDASK